MLIVKCFINDLMTSNCFLVYDKDFLDCLVVDPGSERSEQLIRFLDKMHLVPVFIILTHEHTDHTWGCDVLIDKYDSKVVCTEACKKNIPIEGRSYFQFYYDNLNYEYEVKRIDVILEDVGYSLLWNNHLIDFFATPGHTKGSVCFLLEDLLFTGDTIMQYKTYIHKRTGGSMEQYRISVEKILKYFEEKKIIVYPGHGEPFDLKEYKRNNQ